MWTPARFYSQNFEDLYLYRLFSSVEKGFYIDIGAADHCLHSVTACFYVQGWRGINVEPVSESYLSLCEYRSEDTNLNVAVAATSDSVVEIAVYGDTPGDAGHHRVYTGNTIEAPVNYSVGGQAQTRTVDSTTLRSIFDRYVGCHSVNFLKIDIEGKEFDALQGLDLPSLPAHQRPQVILLEVTIPFTMLDAPHREQCRLLLESNNYMHLFFDGLNDYYCEASLFDKFKPLMLPPNIFDKPSFLPGPGGFGQLFTDREIHAHQLADLRDQIDQLNHDVESVSQKFTESQQQLEEAQHQLAESQQKFAELEQKQLAESQQQLAELQQQLVDSQQQLGLLTDKQSEETKLTTLQLHQVQEELEYYFLLSQKQSEMISAANALNKRAAAIISKSS